MKPIKRTLDIIRTVLLISSGRFLERADFVHFFVLLAGCIAVMVADRFCDEKP